MAKGIKVGTKSNGKVTMGFGRGKVTVETDFGRKVASGLRQAVRAASRFGGMIKK